MELVPYPYTCQEDPIISCLTNGYSTPLHHDDDDVHPHCAAGGAGHGVATVDPPCDDRSTIVSDNLLDGGVVCLFVIGHAQRKILFRDLFGREIIGRGLYVHDLFLRGLSRTLCGLLCHDQIKSTVHLPSIICDVQSDRDYFGE